ncbi:MAG: N-acetylneuraminate synthase [Pelagibacterales bacterium]|nr:N-acetylneuraminate synthase [Pelagibacterales bacterium]|tara:strand:+ start:1955 stop:2803 length:849 start_codon:yes stop_codon:yes gene_type:complete
MHKLIDFDFKTVRNTYLIAEIGINHGGNIQTAKDLVVSAANTGCDAVKFQTYISEKRAPKNKFPDLFNLLKSCELTFNEFEQLKMLCNEKNIEFISTAFDEESIEFLDSIDMKIFKISSFDLLNHKLLEKVANLNKTVITSVGMGTEQEIDDAYKVLAKNGKSKNVILHCISAYPTKEDDAQLMQINILKNKYKECVIGQSDHTNDIVVPCYAVAAGAQIIEKHYKLDDNMDCIDSAVSITEDQMALLVKKVRNIEKMFGQPKRLLSFQEKEVLKYRRKNIL